jgi:hypothetical protein
MATSELEPVSFSSPARSVGQSRGVAVTADLRSRPGTPEETAVSNDPSPEKAESLRREMELLERRRPEIERETGRVKRRIVLVFLTTALVAMALWWMQQ